MAPSPTIPKDHCEGENVGGSLQAAHVAGTGTLPGLNVETPTSNGGRRARFKRGSRWRSTSGPRAHAVRAQVRTTRPVAGGDLYKR